MQQLNFVLNRLRSVNYPQTSKEESNGSIDN